MVDGNSNSSKKVDSNLLLHLHICLSFPAVLFYGLVAVSIQIELAKENETVLFKPSSGFEPTTFLIQVNTSVY